MTQFVDLGISNKLGKSKCLSIQAFYITQLHCTTPSTNEYESKVNMKYDVTERIGK